MEEIIKFCRKLIDMKQLSGVDDQIAQNMAEEMAHKLNDRINKNIISSLQPDEYAEFERLLDNDPTTEQVNQFIENSSVDTKKITIQSMVLFKEYYLGK